MMSWGALVVDRKSRVAASFCGTALSGSGCSVPHLGIVSVLEENVIFSRSSL